MLVLAVVSLGIPLAVSLRDRVNAEVHSQARSQADVVAASTADLISPPATASLDALARSSASSVRGRVLIVDARGRVLADSAGSSTVGASYASRPEIAAALRGRAVQTQRTSHSLGESILATAVPVLRRGSAIGAIRITQSVAAVQSAVASTVAKLGLVAGVVLLLGLLAGGVIARQVALPLGRLEATARRLAGGDLAARASVEGSAEQRSLSASFNEMANRVQSMIGSQREFVADASHQLRTPLTALRLRLEEARVGADDRLAAELDAGTAEVDRLAVIVDELLVLSRAEDRELKGESVELHEALRGAVERWRGTADAHGIELRLTSGAAGTAWCARADLDRALDALIENAIGYSPAGGEVTLDGSDGRIEVRDRGPGLAPGEEQLVFERFHRGSAGRTGPAGSGLGLAIARTLARAWRGEARLENRQGGGAVAVLELPVGEPSPSEL
ncbi:MAG TPA: ATP-binding protein, partial [Solirubrobacteraceae bacterium]